MQAEPLQFRGLTNTEDMKWEEDSFSRDSVGEVSGMGQGHSIKRTKIHYICICQCQRI